MRAMFVVNDMAPQVDPGLVALLEQAETATIGHVLYTGFVDRRIAPLIRGKRVAGTAVTLRLPHADSTLLHYACKLVRPGDVVVIERSGDDKYACWGGGIALAMKLAGVKAGIIDGPATDLSEIEEFDMPVWCRGLSSITTRLLGIEGAMNVPVSIGGQVVNPGDPVLADEQGVLVFSSAALAKEAAERAIGMQTREKTTHARLRAGERLPDISGATSIVEAKMTKSK